MAWLVFLHQLVLPLPQLNLPQFLPQLVLPQFLPLFLLGLVLCLHQLVLPGSCTSGSCACSHHDEGKVKAEATPELLAEACPEVAEADAVLPSVTPPPTIDDGHRSVQEEPEAPEREVEPEPGGMRPYGHRFWHSAFCIFDQLHQLLANCKRLLSRMLLRLPQCTNPDPPQT